MFGFRKQKISYEKGFNRHKQASIQFLLYIRVPSSWHATSVAWTWLRCKAEITTFFFLLRVAKSAGSSYYSNQHGFSLTNTLHWKVG
jgi:hypothetical protein